MHLSTIITKEILNKLVYWDVESKVEEINKDYDLTGIRCRDILAQGTSIA